ncbi:MAG: DUF3750 domain-containing protein [Pseudolabrys sp.]
MFSVHSWVVFKRANARNWTRYDVVGWGMPVRTNGWPADGRWFGNMRWRLPTYPAPKRKS